MDIYSIATKYESLGKETLLEILDTLGADWWPPIDDAEELAYELIDNFTESEVIDASKLDALQHLVELIGLDEICKVADAESKNIPVDNLNEEALRDLLKRFQHNMWIAAYKQHFADPSNRNFRDCLNFFYETMTEEELRKIQE